MTHIKTSRLELTAATIELSEAELNDRDKFSKLLDTTIPNNWPPETATDALPWFLDILKKNPEWVGWLTWYAVLTNENTLVGGAGFKGAPNTAGMVEIGYSVLPEYQKRGIASEIVEALCKWAFEHDSVKCIEAETVPDNSGSLKVLSKNGFEFIGAGSEEGSVRYRLNKFQITTKLTK
jgi:[ribosomal protein S5]-alanine N-acetyltransferase